MFLKILLITFILVGIAFAGLGIRLLLDNESEFRGGNCQSGSEEMEKKEISCGCGTGTCVSNNQEVTS